MKNQNSTELIKTIQLALQELYLRLKTVKVEFFTPKDTLDDNDNWHEAHQLIIHNKHGEPQDYKVRALDNGVVICQTYPDGDNFETRNIHELNADDIIALSSMMDNI